MPNASMLSQLKAYFKAPFDQLEDAASLSDKVKALGSILLLDLGFALLAGVVIGLVGELELVDMDNHAVATALGQFSVWQIMLIAVLGTPLLEELVFRLPLRYQANPVAGLARLLTPKTEPAVDSELAAQRRAWWDRNYRFIFYGLGVAFAYLHLTNYPDITLGLLLLSPLLVAPQFVMGILAGFLRVRFGFWWAFLLHALHNLILVGLAVFGTGNTEVITIENDAHRLVVEEVSPLDSEIDFSYTFGIDTVGYDNVKLSYVIRTLVSGADDAVVRFPEGKADPRLNVALKYHSGEQPMKAYLLDTLTGFYEIRVDEQLLGDTIVVNSVN